MSTWTRMVDQLSAVKLLISIRSKHHTAHAYSPHYSPMFYLHMLCAASACSLVVRFGLHLLVSWRACVLWMWCRGTLASTTATFDELISAVASVYSSGVKMAFSTKVKILRKHLSAFVATRKPDLAVQCLLTTDEAKACELQHIS
jgi:hypothetical protein